MADKTGVKDIVEVIDSKNMVIMSNTRHSDRVRTDVINQSLELLENIFLADYGWTIHHADLFGSPDASWNINATAQGNYELGDFDPDNIESLTYRHDDDEVILRVHAPEEDEIMKEIRERAIEETRDEIASETRYSVEDMEVMHTTITHSINRDITNPMNTRIRMSY